MAARTGTFALSIALIVSLVLHLSAFGLVRTIREWRPAAVTEARAPETEPESVPDQAAPPEEEFTPGIENGAPAVVTWIGYEEYEEHLARLAETDQAAFTSAVAKGVPDSTSPVQAPPEQTPPEAQPEASPPPIETTAAAVEPPPVEVNPNEPPEPIVESVEPPLPPRVEPIEAPTTPSEQMVPEPVKVEPRETERTEATPAEAPAEPPVDVEAPREPDSSEPAEQPVTPREEPRIEPTPDPEPSLLPTTVPTPVPGVTPVPVSTPQGEPVAPDAQQSEKDAAATSTRQVVETKWDNGKPLAAEGMELRPFPLYRHITWDSRDVMFAQQLNRGRWEGRVVRNPIVSMRFDRHGRVGEVRIIRPSGFASLDQLYLKSWIARWTAVDRRLAELGPDELTNAIQMKIVFIEEPEPKADGEKK